MRDAFRWTPTEKGTNDLARLRHCEPFPAAHKDSNHAQSYLDWLPQRVKYH
jgi:hypothetical protein